MLNGISYHEWTQKRTKGIVDFYGYKFFYLKKVLDLGCGHGDLGGVVYRLGSAVTSVDARQDHLKVVNKKFSGIKTVLANLDTQWPFHGQKFDIVFDLALLCHLEDYESHIKTICASTTHLILETAVCDSDDPNKCIIIDEDKSIHDISFGGKGCRPSAAAVERVLKECGMNFKRMDNSKFNSENYSYDWYPKNDNSTSLDKRRLWFAIKENSAIQFANPASEIAIAPIIISDIKQPTIHDRIATKVSPKVPQMELEAKAKINANNQSIKDSTSNNSSLINVPNTYYISKNNNSIDDNVRLDSKEYALIEIDNFISPITSQLSCVIYPNTVSSKMWYKKISPFFPNVKLSKNILTMPGFAKIDKDPDLIMFSLNNLQVHKRVWIDEWVGQKLTDANIGTLKKCHTIITPSLLNAQEILKHLPEANILRIQKPWFLLDVAKTDSNYFLYFEKYSELTKLLFDSWDEKFGNLVVVGSNIKLPSFATFVSDTESYVNINKLILGSRAIIDLSENNYYASGINKLCYAMGLPIITNNHFRLDENVVFIQQNKQVSNLPTTDNIKQSLNKFINKISSKANSAGSYNQAMIEDFRKMIGI